MPANDHQIGGTHYSVLPYQHWDWVADAGLTYLQGQATKYLARYPQTHSLEDLRKAAHYCEKLAELNGARDGACERFVQQFTDERLVDALINVADNCPNQAAARIQHLIARHSATPVPLTEETHHGERTGSPEDFYCKALSIHSARCETQCNHCYEEEHAQGV